MSDQEQQNQNLSTEQEEPKKKWNEVAEVRMVLYVVPVAIVFVIIALILS